MRPRHRQGDTAARLKRTTPAPRAAAVLLPAMFRAVAEAAGRWQRSEEPEALHDLRIAARRYRGAVRFFKPLLRGEFVGRVLAAVDRLAVVSGPLRDADMLAGLGYRARQDTVGGTPRRAELREFLGGAKFLALRKEATRLHRTCRSSRSRSKAPVLGAFSVMRMRDRLEDLTSRDLLRHMDSPNRIHATRKRVRRLRYWAEMVTPPCGIQMGRLATRLHDVATALGELHDIDVAAENRRSLPRALRRLRRERVRKARSAWRALTEREGCRLVDSAMASASRSESR